MRINVGTTLDPYTLDDNNIRINKYHITNGGGLLRMTSANLNLNYSFSSKQLEGKKDQNELNEMESTSSGGRDDDLIESEGLRESVVVFSEAEAEEKGLEIDHNDSHAAVPDWEFDNFALLVHGTQPKGSQAAEALKLLKKNNVKHSYSRKVGV